MVEKVLRKRTAHEAVCLDAPILCHVITAIEQELRLNVNGWLFPGASPEKLPLWSTYHALIQFVEAHPDTQFMLVVADPSARV